MNVMFVHFFKIHAYACAQYEEVIKPRRYLEVHENRAEFNYPIMTSCCSCCCFDSKDRVEVLYFDKVEKMTVAKCCTPYHCCYCIPCCGGVVAYGGCCGCLCRKYKICVILEGQESQDVLCYIWLQLRQIV